MRAAVVGRGDGTESLLTGSIPLLEYSVRREREREGGSSAMDDERFEDGRENVSEFVKMLENPSARLRLCRVRK